MAAAQPNFGIPSEHEASFKALTQSTQEKVFLSRPESLESRDLCDGISDPPTLLCVALFARQFDPDGALKQFQEACEFREKKHILRLYDSVDISDFEQARQFGQKRATYLHVRRGASGQRYRCTLGNVTQEQLLDIYSKSGNGEPPKPDMLQLASVYYDHLVRFVIPLCSMMTDRPNPSVPATNSIYVVDASSLGIKQAWGLRSFAQEISWLLSTCYPETIERIFVCNAPSYYSTIWRFLKAWVDPRTAEKIVVLMESEVLPTLREYIDDANIPANFGGEFQFTHGMLPDLDDNIQQLLNSGSSKSLPPGPLKWTKDSDGRQTALAVGSKSGSVRNDKIATLDIIAQ
ncbi:hypothetical protein N7524_001680 [Penicillium chrysogenum]|nr:hypothetical protein N7524_001680 [Penicillium chrysogenum]